MPILLALSGCSPAPDGRNDLSFNEIRAVSTPEPAASDAAAVLELAPLAPADADGFGAGSCRFVRNGHLLVAASANRAVARPRGALRHLVPSAPPAETGAFLEDRQLSISIGRTAPDGSAALIAVTNRRTGVEQRWAGNWSCSR